MGKVGEGREEDMDVERDRQDAKDRQSWDEFVSTGRFWVRKAGGTGGR